MQEHTGAHSRSKRRLFVMLPAGAWAQHHDLTHGRPGQRPRPLSNSGIVASTLWHLPMSADGLLAACSPSARMRNHAYSKRHVYPRPARSDHSKEQTGEHHFRNSCSHSVTICEVSKDTTRVHEPQLVPARTQAHSAPLDGQVRRQHSPRQRGVLG